LAGIVLGTSLLAASSGAAIAQQQYKLRVAHALAPGEPIHLIAEDFAKAVTQRSKGRVQVQVFPSEQLGINKDMLEQVRQGAPIIQIADPGFMSDYVPDFGVLNGPYLISNPAEFKKLLASDWYRELKEKSEKAGLRPLAFNFFFGVRNMLGNKPFRSPADLQGVTMRIAPNPLWVETFKALGARGVPLPWTEVYGALAQNVVDAVEAPLGSLNASKLQEQRKTLSMTGHFTAFLGFVMSDKMFRSFPPDIQQILTEEAEKAGDRMTLLTIENDKKLIEDLKKQGVTVVTNVDLAALRAATAPVYAAFPKWTPGLHDKIRKILAN
jgi:tripartite ATP-independent transporter DctP family solute receptor